LRKRRSTVIRIFRSGWREDASFGSSPGIHLARDESLAADDADLDRDHEDWHIHVLEDLIDTQPLTP